MLPRGTISSQSFCKRSWPRGALGCRGVCALGVARAQAYVLQFVMGARFGEAALDSVHEGQEYSLVLGEFCQVALED